MAAILSNKIHIPHGAKVVTPICGGNIDSTMLSRIIEKVLHKSKRLVRLNITISDRPGGLHQLAGLIAQTKANILQISHERSSMLVPFYNTGTSVTLETRGPDHIEEILKTLQEQSYRFEILD